APGSRAPRRARPGLREAWRHPEMKTPTRHAIRYTRMSLVFFTGGQEFSRSVIDRFEKPPLDRAVVENAADDAAGQRHVPFIAVVAVLPPIPRRPPRAGRLDDGAMRHAAPGRRDGGRPAAINADPDRRRHALTAEHQGEFRGARPQGRANWSSSMP